MMKNEWLRRIAPEDPLIWMLGTLVILGLVYNDLIFFVQVADPQLAVKQAQALQQEFLQKISP